MNATRVRFERLSCLRIDLDGGVLLLQSTQVHPVELIGVDALPKQVADPWGQKLQSGRQDEFFDREPLGICDDDPIPFLGFADGDHD